MGVVAVNRDMAGTIKMQLRQVGERAAKHGVEFMREEAERAVELARYNAPHDEGKLEAAIQLSPEAVDENRRKTVGIWVNPEMPGSGGMRVGEYALMVHEDMMPYGEINRGAGTIAKGPQAGAKYFERAIKKILPKLTAKITDLLRRQGLK